MKCATILWFVLIAAAPNCWADYSEEDYHEDLNVVAGAFQNIVVVVGDAAKKDIGNLVESATVAGTALDNVVDAAQSGDSVFEATVLGASEIAQSFLTTYIDSRLTKLTNPFLVGAGILGSEAIIGLGGDFFEAFITGNPEVPQSDVLPMLSSLDAFEVSSLIANGMSVHDLPPPDPNGPTWEEVAAQAGVDWSPTDFFDEDYVGVAKGEGGDEENSEKEESDEKRILTFEEIEFVWQYYGLFIARHREVKEWSKQQATDGVMAELERLGRMEKDASRLLTEFGTWYKDGSESDLRELAKSYGEEIEWGTRKATETQSKSKSSFLKEAAQLLEGKVSEKTLEELRRGGERLKDF